MKFIYVHAVSTRAANDRLMPVKLSTCAMSRSPAQRRVDIATRFFASAGIARESGAALSR
jgi:hypothetical protein